MDEGTPKRAGVDWVEVSKAIAMPIVTLIVGSLLTGSLNMRQARDSDVRLYADMMGRREEADSALRKDMFRSILETFLKKEPTLARPDPETDVLNLELLAYNFHESLDLGPLFKHVQRNLLDEPGPAGGPRDEARLWRLERVAEEIKERQLAVLSDSGMVERGELDVHKSGAEAWEFGKSTIRLKPTEKRGGTTLCLSVPSRDTKGSIDGGRRYRQFKVEFLDFVKNRREVELSLSVSKPLSKRDCEQIQNPAVEQDNLETEAQFWVGPFGFPMIDNTRLTHSERCSISVTRILQDSVSIAAAYFPASRASLKDKPYYDEVLHDLLHAPSIRHDDER